MATNENIFETIVRRICRSWHAELPSDENGWWWSREIAEAEKALEEYGVQHSEPEPPPKGRSIRLVRREECVFCGCKLQ